MGFSSIAGEGGDAHMVGIDEGCCLQATVPVIPLSTVRGVLSHEAILMESSGGLLQVNDSGLPVAPSFVGDGLSQRMRKKRRWSASEKGKMPLVQPAKDDVFQPLSLMLLWLRGRKILALILLQQILVVRPKLLLSNEEPSKEIPNEVSVEHENPVAGSDDVADGGNTGKWADVADSEGAVMGNSDGVSIQKTVQNSPGLFVSRMDNSSVLMAVNGQCDFRASPISGEVRQDGSRVEARPVASSDMDESDSPLDSQGALQLGTSSLNVSAGRVEVVCKPPSCRLPRGTMRFTNPAP
ncbi:hypothetical protein NE237_010811 [Protea cynaroides]|uniref:Uncharacterized protein n=1 Tax=Protea cynaroides TaxID=273540 RepID=A0A9Q0L1B5_9MAGN|nr:hypothetical protein NE237_010811 [Protea cynaroides]